QISARYDIPIIYLTAYADDRTLERAKITEPFGYIVKPFDERDLHTAIDIALYKHGMEKRLKEREIHLSALFNSIGDAIITTDTFGKVSYMNPAAERLTGWKLGDAVNKDLDSLIQIVEQKDRQQSLNLFETCSREGILSAFGGQKLLINRERKEFYIDYTCTLMKDAREKTIGAVIVLRDVTEMALMQGHINTTQKLESISVLAGGIAHDFNNILTAVLGNVSLANTLANPDGKIHERLTIAEEAIKRAQDLAHQLLVFSKGGAPLKKPTSVGALIRESADFVLSGSNIKCKYSAPEDLWFAEIDHGQINQAFNNLIINAKQAMHQGGTIEINCSNINIDDDFKQLKRGRYVKVSVRDHGVGIPKENLQKIFDPFFTTKDKGSGLGLYTTHSIIQKHNGHMTVESTQGKGTCFHIYLPASLERAYDDAAPEGSLTKGSGRILIMDDEKMVREVAGEMLRYLGYDVDFAKDGDEAVRIYKKAMASEHPFDLVIMDLTIPGGRGGKEAIRYLCEIDKDAKV
ncbi:MAG: ATP-binding protein, partial [Nitrospirae bacterium]|nr:ATP-binding protein [Nitrospirota bacterium]